MQDAQRFTGRIDDEQRCNRAFVRVHREQGFTGERVRADGVITSPTRRVNKSGTIERRRSPSVRIP